MSSSIAKPILYSFWASSCSWRVRAALKLKKIPFELRPINLMKATSGGQQHSEEFRKINPMGFVPALHIDGLTLIESNNILQYLEEARPHFKLLPEDIKQRVKVREICDIIISGIQPLQNLTVLYKVGKEREEEWSHYYIGKGFAAIEKLLENSSGKFCVGDSVTLADCCLIPQVFNARRYKVDMTPFKKIVSIEENLKNHVAFIESHPNNQPKE